MKAGLRAAGFVLFLQAVPAQGQDTNDLEALLERPVVSTPSKSAETADVAPAVSSVITADDLRRYGIRSLDEALNFLSLGVTTTTPFHAVEVGARGVLLTADYGNHMLLLVDGQALNEPWNGTAYFERGAMIPFELIDHIEVLLGPGSVLYGSQAMFGVINIVTKRARDYSGVHVIAEGDLTSPTTHNGNLVPITRDEYPGDLGKGYRVAAGIGRELKLFSRPAEIVAQLEYYREQGPAFQVGPQNYGDDAVTGMPKNFGPKTPLGIWRGRVQDAAFTEVPAFYGTLRVGDTELLLRAGMYRRGIPFQDTVVSDEGSFDDPEAFERDRAANLELRTRATLSKLTALTLRVYSGHNDYRWHSPNLAAEDCPDGSTEGCIRDLSGKGQTLGTEAKLGIDIPGMARAHTLVGMDLKVTRVDSDLDVVDRTTGTLTSAENDYSETRVPIAAFVEQGVSPTTWMDVNLGARMDYVADYDPSLSPRGAIGISPWDMARLKLIYSEAFRSPTAYERYYADPNFEVAAPNLKAERERSVEVFLEQRFGLQRVAFGVFRSFWFDMVQNRLLDQAELDAAVARGDLATGTEEAYVNRNAGQIDNYGFNGGFDGLAVGRRLAYGLNITGAYTRIDSGDGTEALPPTAGPMYFGNARVAYRVTDAAPWLGLAANYQAQRQVSLAYDSGYDPAPSAPAQLALKGTVSGEIPALDALSYRWGVTYAFHHHGPYLTGPNQYAQDPQATPELVPVARLSTFLGLEYVLGK